MLGLDDKLERALPLESTALVAVDLDGTLLRSDHTLCPRSAKAVVAATQKGIKVVLATGRAPRSVQKTHRALGLTTLAICHNGALIYDPIQEKVVYHRSLTPQVAREVIRYARQVDPNLPVGVQVIDHCYTDRPGSHRAIHDEPLAGGSHPPDLKGALEEALSGPVTKVMLVGTPQILGKLQMDLGTHLPGELSFAMSDMRLLQVLHADADKSTALQKIAAHYGINRERVMAIGDAQNDLGMIRWAGLGVAMGNSWPEVSSAAHFVVDSNDEGGVAAALERYVLSV